MADLRAAHLAADWVELSVVYWDAPMVEQKVDLLAAKRAVRSVDLMVVT